MSVYDRRIVQFRGEALLFHLHDNVIERITKVPLHECGWCDEDYPNLECSDCSGAYSWHDPVDIPEEAVPDLTQAITGLLGLSIRVVRLECSDTLQFLLEGYDARDEG